MFNIVKEARTWDARYRGNTNWDRVLVGLTLFRCVVGGQGVEHVIDDLFDGVRDRGQRRQLEGSGLHQLHRVGPLDTQVLKLII